MLCPEAVHCLTRVWGLLTEKWRLLQSQRMNKEIISFRCPSVRLSHSYVTENQQQQREDSSLFKSKILVKFQVGKICDFQRIFRYIRNDRIRYEKSCSRSHCTAYND